MLSQISQAVQLCLAREEQGAQLRIISEPLLFRYSPSRSNKVPFYCSVAANTLRWRAANAKNVEKHAIAYLYPRTSW